MNLEQKKAAVADLVELLNKAQAWFLLSQKGLDMPTITQARADLRKEGANLKVIKNTMMARAVEGTPWEFVNDWLRVLWPSLIPNQTLLVLLRPWLPL